MYATERPDYQMHAYTARKVIVIIVAMKVPQYAMDSSSAYVQGYHI